jgi:hypothetical protein
VICILFLLWSNRQEGARRLAGPDPSGSAASGGGAAGRKRLPAEDRRRADDREGDPPRSQQQDWERRTGAVESLQRLRGLAGGLRLLTKYDLEVASPLPSTCACWDSRWPKWSC